MAVDDEGAVEDLVAAMFRVDLGEAINLTIGQLPPDLLGNAVEVGNLLVAQCQTFLLVVGGNVVDMLHWLRLAVHGKDLLVQVMVHGLKHRIEWGVFRGYLMEFLDAPDAFDAHVLGNLHGIGTPWRNHLTSGADEEPLDALGLGHGGLAKEP